MVVLAAGASSCRFNNLALVAFQHELVLPLANKNSLLVNH